MADITMCEDSTCKKHNRCYRFTAPKNQYWQSVFTMSPRKDKTCEYFWDNNNKEERLRTDCE